MSQQTAVIFGAGAGLGGAIARRFARGGLHACVVRRKQGHVIVDGPIDMPWIRENFPQLVEQRPKDGLLQPDDVAESYWSLHSQPRSAWTHELDLRPFLEPW
jgi:NADP-dependent 3-hydroxy acid dehydrogenase YdfG